MKEGIKKITDFVLDCVFPHSCFLCGASDTYFCTTCHTVDWFTKPTGIFAAPFDSSVHMVTSLTRYVAGQGAARLIEDFKYSFIGSAGAEIHTWIKNTSWLSQRVGECDIIIPVPLHRRRLAERGYNQAEIIAGYVGGIINRPVDSSFLVRARSTKQQAKLTRAERITNITDAFVCYPSTKITGQKILLIDDVYTTGSTVYECAEVLRTAGAQTVSVFTLARG